MIASFASAALMAEEAKNSDSHSRVYVSLGGHIENRDSVSKNHIDAYAGYDLLMSEENRIYVGGRLGIFQEQVLTSIPVTNLSTKFYVGTQAYKLFGLSDSVDLRTGVNLDLATGDSVSPVYLYLGGHAGPRFHLSQTVHLDIPIEIGFWPAFTGVPVMFRGVVQVGLSL